MTGFNSKRKAAQDKLEQWDNEAFNAWWDSDYDDSANPYEINTFAYWAWAGWQAALAQADMTGFDSKTKAAQGELAQRVTAQQQQQDGMRGPRPTSSGEQTAQPAQEPYGYVSIGDHPVFQKETPEIGRWETVYTTPPAAQPAPVQEPEYWNVIDPAGNVVASETDAIRGWARIAGSYKPTVEGLLGFHEQGWRVLPKANPPLPAQRTEPAQEPVCPKCKAGVLYECVACSSNNYPPQGAQEPVAWMRPSEEGYDSAFRDHSTVMVCTGNPWTGWIPLYTASPQRPWVDLTDDELAECWTTSATQTWKNFEAKLKEKNT